MQVLQLKQGSPEWHAHRASHFNASDAPAMMSCSAYMTRTQLIHRLATGIAADIDASTQRRFDEGHRSEALALPLAEDILGEDLSPVVGVLGKLSASFDGLTMIHDTAFEHKSLNDTLRAAMLPGCTGADLPEMYQVQMEQQCAVSGAGRVLFMASKWAGDDLIEERHCWYTPNPALRARILAGWDQLEADVAAYVPTQIVERPAAVITLELPALVIHATGEITTSNMKEYGEALARRLAEVRAIAFVTDQDFSNAKASAKLLRENIQQAGHAKEAMLAQTVTVGEAARMIDAWCEDMRLTALKLEKDVEREDLAKKAAMTSGAKKAYDAHVQAIEKDIAPGKLALPSPAFGEALKGKRNYASMQDAVDAALANAKIAADMQAAQIRHNRDQLRPQAGVAGEDWISLFPDFVHVCAKSADDFHDLVTTRVATEQERIRADREKVHEEEAAKLRTQQAAQQSTRAVVQTATAAAQAASAPPAEPDLLTPDTFPEPAATEVPTLKLGTMAERLGFALPGAFLMTLGFEPAARERAAPLYRESDWPRITAALVAHINRVRTAQPA